jgi:hypothetical protein
MCNLLYKELKQYNVLIYSFFGVRPVFQHRLSHVGWRYPTKISVGTVVTHYTTTILGLLYLIRQSRKTTQKC